MHEKEPDDHGPLPVEVVVEGGVHLHGLLLKLRQGGGHGPVQLLLVQECTGADAEVQVERCRWRGASAEVQVRVQR